MNEEEEEEDINPNDLKDIEYIFNGTSVLTKNPSSIINQDLILKFEDFLQHVKEVSPSEYSNNIWTMLCKKKNTYFFSQTSTMKFRSKEHYLKEFWKKTEIEMKKKQLLIIEEEQNKNNVIIKTEKKKKKNIIKKTNNNNNKRRKKQKIIENVNEIDFLVNLLESSNSIIVILGAGVSTSAGLPDFRSKTTGLYATIGQDFSLPAELLFHSETFEQDPVPFYSFATKTFLPQIEIAKPTPTHNFVQELNEQGKLLRCYTQNVDGLERIAGIPENRLMECHGTLRSAKCLKCKNRISQPYWWKVKTIANKGVPECEKPGCLGDLRPDMIFFGEQVSNRVDLQINRDAKKCDLILIIGTSLSVQPVSEILQSVQEQVPRIWINRVLPPQDKYFQLIQKGECDQILIHAMKNLKWSQ